MLYAIYFTNTFRVNINTFNYICNEISPYITSNARKNKPMNEMKLAIALWR